MNNKKFLSIWVFLTCIALCYGATVYDPILGKLRTLDVTDISGKQNLVVPTAAGNIARLNIAGQVYDAGTLAVMMAEQKAISSDVTTGTDDSKYTTVKSLVDSANAASGFVRLDGSAKLPAVDGSQLTGISSARVWQVITGSGAYTAETGKGYIFDATANNVTLTLPSPALSSDVRFIVRNNTNTCTLARSGSESIDGNAGNLVLDTLRGANGVVSDGTDWFLIYK